MVDDSYRKILVILSQNGLFSVEKDLSRYFSNLYVPFETEQNGSNLVRFKRAKRPSQAAEPTQPRAREDVHPREGQVASM